MTEKFNRVTCEFTESEKERHEEIRCKIIKEYPPADGRSAEPAGYGVAFYAARKSAGMDWYDVALAAGLDDAAITPRGRMSRPWRKRWGCRSKSERLADQLGRNNGTRK